jgi:hypothetical protein
MEEINDKHEIYQPYKAPCPNCRNGFNLFNFTCKTFQKGMIRQL